MKKEGTSQNQSRNGDNFFTTILVIIVAIMLIKSIIDYNATPNPTPQNYQESQTQASQSVDVEDITPQVSTNIRIPQLGSKKDIFSKYYNEAEEMLKYMTLSEKVGQMFIARYPGTQSAIDVVKDEYPGGFNLFSEDFEFQSLEGMQNELAYLQEHSKKPLFFSVDEEGGSVVRITEHSQYRDERFKSPQDLYDIGGLPAILDESTEKCRLLSTIGVNINFAPVVDVPTNPSSFIYERTFGKSGKETADYAAEIIKNMNENNIISALKHFPGYGDNVDTHTGVAIDSRDFETLANNDLLPFIAGIKEKAPTIMVSHNIVECMDPTNPASLSPEVHRYLREDLGFTGLILTDDLCMGAVSSYAQNGQVATKAVLAGNDILVTTDFINQKREIISAVNQGIIPIETIDTAVKRILTCKLYYGVM